MLILNEKDMRSAVSCEELIASVEDAFHWFTTGTCKMADRAIAEDKGNVVMYMPCFTENYISTKMLLEFPKNPAKGLPYLDGMVILNRAEDGKIISLMNGNVLTALRTGAVGGLAVREFSHPGSTRLGLVGCGTQGLHQLWVTCTTQPQISEVYLYDSFKQDLSGFIASLEKMIAPRTVSVTVCKDAAELLAQSQIVITATQAREPLFPNDPAKLEGKCFVAIGSWRPQMREIPDAIWQLIDHVTIELPFAMEESGDLSQPLEAGLYTEEKVRYMGQYLEDKKNGILPELTPTRYYKSVGMGVFDQAAAVRIYQKALEKGLGIQAEL